MYITLNIDIYWIYNAIKTKYLKLKLVNQIPINKNICFKECIEFKFIQN